VASREAWVVRSAASRPAASSPPASSPTVASGALAASAGGPPGTAAKVSAGMAGSGATETLGSLAVSLARTYGPNRLWVYGLDFGTQALAGLSGLPHCGGIIGSSDRERQFRLVRFLAEELERRRRHVAAQGAVKVDPADPASPFPSIVLLVDNYGALSAAWDDPAGSTLRDVLVRTIADGPGLGLVAAISTDRPLGLPGALPVPNRRAIELSPNLAAPRYALGTLLVRQGRRKEGEEQLALHHTLYARASQRIFEAQSSHGAIQLAESQISRGQAGQALALLDGFPESADLLRARAQALSGLGRHEEAVAALERARELEPDAARLRTLLAAERARVAKTP